MVKENRLNEQYELIQMEDNPPNEYLLQLIQLKWRDIIKGIHLLKALSSLSSNLRADSVFLLL